MSDPYERALEIVAELTAAGIPATCDTRSATPPCVLVPPPALDMNIACGATATWGLQALAVGPGNADAFKQLAELVRDVRAVLPVERADPGAYVLSPDAPAFPAYRIEFKEGIDL